VKTKIIRSNQNCGSSFLPAVLTLIVLLTLFVGCKKKSGPVPDVDPHPGYTPTEKGAIIGTPVAKEIGAAGGTVETPDGNVGLVIPAGALEGNVAISVTEVANTLPNGAIGKSYRFLPENIKFKKDVELSLKYGDLIGTTSDWLYLAYQDAKGYWFITEANVDVGKRMVTAKTRHFSDWSIVSTATLVNRGKSALDPLETTEFEINIIEPPKDEINHDDLLAPTTSALLKNRIEGWKIEGYATGVGVINAEKKISATYTAPPFIETMKRIDVVVSISEKAQPDPKRPGQQGKLVLRQPIRLLPEEYLYWTVSLRGGGSGTDAAQTINVSGTDDLRVSGVSHTGSSVNFVSPDKTFGRKVFGANKASATYRPNEAYRSNYTDCNGQSVHTPGDVLITKVDGKKISGEVFGELRYRRPNGCQFTVVDIEANFRVKTN
jgi:hypothetical protein